jgi:predicted acetyltransferase
MNSQLDFQITYPSEKDKQGIADLWLESFNDSPEYIKIFFNRVYKPENTLVIKRNGVIVSALQMIPYEAMISQKILPVAYICGACTHPFERGQGLMKILINHAIAEMKKRSFAFSVVIPALPSLFDYYHKLGFTVPILHCFEKINTLVRINKDISYTFKNCTIDHFQYFDRKQREECRCILHSEYDFETILQEYNCDGGRSFVALSDNTPLGMD